jgi:hypothetical protein
MGDGTLEGAYCARCFGSDASVLGLGVAAGAQRDFGDTLKESPSL